MSQTTADPAAYQPRHQRSELRRRIYAAIGQHLATDLEYGRRQVTLAAREAVVERLATLDHCALLGSPYLGDDGWAALEALVTEAELPTEWLDDLRASWFREAVIESAYQLGAQRVLAALVEEVR